MKAILLTWMFAVICALPLSATEPEHWVLECDLAATEADILSSSVRFYMWKGKPHSAFLEFAIDSGDTLPFVFLCETTCIMDMNGEDRTYELTATPDMLHPEALAMLTQSKIDEFSTLDRFAVLSCEIR